MADPVTSLRSDGSQRLATYGSLAPGRANEHQLTNLNGVWYTGEVYGTLVESGWGADLGFPGIILGRDGQAVPVHVFESADLPSHWARLDEFEGPGSLPAEATRRLGGLAMLLESDRTIRAFIDGQPLLVRRGEHWTSFPLELGSAIGRMIDGGSAAQLVVQTALAISAGRHGAILAVVPSADRLDGIVPLKDRYDLRNDVDREAMRIETRLHHLIDADPLDSPTLSRLASLDGATIIDRDSNLLAYGAVVASSDSQNEGARTAAAKTLSQHAEVVLKVSADGDITIFRDGALVTTLLGSLLTMPRL